MESFYNGAAAAASDRRFISQELSSRPPCGFYLIQKQAFIAALSQLRVRCFICVRTLAEALKQTCGLSQITPVVSRGAASRVFLKEFVCLGSERQKKVVLQERKTNR